MNKPIEGFVKSIFDHPVDKPEWYWNGSWEAPSLDNLILFMAELHTNPLRHLVPYDDCQIEQGLRFMLCPGLSDCHRSLCMQSLNLANRIDAVKSIFNFFEIIYCSRCTNISTFSEAKKVNPLNNSCFMWWDISPLIGSLEEDIIESCVTVMEGCLYLPNIACQESAIHGLGHLGNEEKWNNKCKKIIDDFLCSSASNSPGLKLYAKAACEGKIQ